MIILAVVKVDSKGRSLSLNWRAYQARIVSTIRYSRYLKIETKMSVIVKIRSCSSLHASFLGTKMAKERQGNKLKREELRKFRGDEGRGAKEVCRVNSNVTRAEKRRKRESERKKNRMINGVINSLGERCFVHDNNRDEG